MKTEARELNRPRTPWPIRCLVIQSNVYLPSTWSHPDVNHLCRLDSHALMAHLNLTATLQLVALTIQSVLTVMIPAPEHLGLY